MLPASEITEWREYLKHDPGPLGSIERVLAMQCSLLHGLGSKRPDRPDRFMVDYWRGYDPPTVLSNAALIAKLDSQTGI